MGTHDNNPAPFRHVCPLQNPTPQFGKAYLPFRTLMVCDNAFEQQDSDVKKQRRISARYWEHSAHNKTSMLLSYVLDHVVDLAQLLYQCTRWLQVETPKTENRAATKQHQPVCSALQLWGSQKPYKRPRARRAIRSAIQVFQTFNTFLLSAGLLAATWELVGSIFKLNDFMLTLQQGT